MPQTTSQQKQKPTIKVGLCFWWEWVDWLGCACAAFVSAQTSQSLFLLTHSRTKQTAFVWSNTINHVTAKIKNDHAGRFLFLVGVGGFEPPQS